MKVASPRPMRAETIPIVIGGLIGLLGLGLVLDAWLPDEARVSGERRRLARLPRDRAGEALVGLGIIAMAAAFIGLDTWKWSVTTVAIGAVLLLWGAKRSSGYLGAAFRGSVHRGRGIGREPRSGRSAQGGERQPSAPQRAQDPQRTERPLPEPRARSGRSSGT